MNVNITIITEDRGKKQSEPLTFTGVGYIIIDSQWVKFGKDSQHPEDGWKVSRRATKPKVIIWEDKEEKQHEDN